MKQNGRRKSTPLQNHESVTEFGIQAKAELKTSIKDALAGRIFKYRKAAELKKLFFPPFVLNWLNSNSGKKIVQSFTFCQQVEQIVATAFPSRLHTSRDEQPTFVR